MEIVDSAAPEPAGARQDGVDGARAWRTLVLEGPPGCRLPRSDGDRERRPRG